MGKRKIIVSERDNLAALFEDDLAIEFLIHRGDMLLGDVYLASVENILPSIDAAFVNVGGDKMGFLHSSDVPGKGDLKNRLQPKQQLVVQVMKEPTGHKGPRVTTNISLPGRFLVLMPESKGISISRKIEQQTERSRLKSVVSLIKPPGVGVIIRTEADQQKESDIQEDFETLIERWQNIVSMADSATPPTLLYRDQDLLYRVIREAVTDDVKELYVDTNFGQQRAQQLLQNWNMDKNIKVQLYTGNQSILIGMGVDKEIKQALQTKVPLPSGGYLYIQPTEALCVIDVNSGKFTSLQSQADTIRQTNLEATKEIARQLRLRNIGGMIIVDFIDMESRADKLTILEAFEMELAPDKSKPQIGQLSDLGLVEMTRHRQGQALSEIFTKRCIACNGTGHATEEFNWAPPMLDGDPRTTARPGSMRNKLPIRQGRQQQGGGRQGGGNQGDRQGGGQGGGNAAQQGLSIKKVIEAGKPESAPEQKPAGTLLQQAAAAQAKPTLPDDKTLDEILRDRISQKLGIRFASIVKLAHTPPGINSVLVRINPKSNDILTLVDTIEGTIGMPMPMIEDEDGDEMDMPQQQQPAAVGARPMHGRSPRLVEDGERQPKAEAGSRQAYLPLDNDFESMDEEDGGDEEKQPASSRPDPRYRHDGRHPGGQRRDDRHRGDHRQDNRQDNRRIQPVERAPIAAPEAKIALEEVEEAVLELEEVLQEALIEEADVEVKPRRTGRIPSTKRPEADIEVEVALDAEDEEDESSEAEAEEKPKRRRGRPPKGGKATADATEEPGPDDEGGPRRGRRTPAPSED